MQSRIALRRSSARRPSDVAEVFKTMESSGDVQERSAYEVARARILLAQDDFSEASAMAHRAFSSYSELGLAAEAVKEGFAIACEAELALGDIAQLTERLGFVEALPPGRSTRFLRAHTSRFRAHLAGSDDLAAAQRGFGEAAALFREIGMPFYLAVVQLEHAEFLVALDRAEGAGPLLTEAREAFDRLRAVPWLERVDALGIGAVATA